MNIYVGNSYHPRSPKRSCRRLLKSSTMSRMPILAEADEFIQLIGRKVIVGKSITT